MTPCYILCIENMKWWRNIVFWSDEWNPLALTHPIISESLIWNADFNFFCRFCSRPFTLTCGHESIHLCNNAVQARYTNAERSSKLPSDNMWDNKTFIQFLKDNGAGDKWHSLIYPTMKKCLISTIVYEFSQCMCI